MPVPAARLKQQLELLQKLRTFAEHDLKLPVDGHYAKYVDVHRPFVVRNVEAAPELDGSVIVEESALEPARRAICPVYPFCDR